MTGHWSRTCRTLKHLVDLYQASIKEERKGIKMHFTDHYEPIDINHLDVSDFFEDFEGEIDHLIGDGNVYTN